MSANNIIEIIELNDDDSDSSSVVEIECVLAPRKTDRNVTQNEGNFIDTGLPNPNQIKITRIESLSGKEHYWTDDVKPIKPATLPEVLTPPDDSSSNSLLKFQQNSATGQFNLVLPKEEETTEFAEESETINLSSDLDYYNGEFNSTLRHHKIYQCMECDFAAFSKMSFKTHTEAHNNNNSFKCPKCPFIAINKSTFRSHFICKHSNVKKPFQCQICHFSTYFQSALQQHIKIHGADRSYECQYCPYAAITKSYLAIHLHNHFTQPKYPCSVCSFSALSADQLKNHFICHKS
ncbi:GSCOCG00011479001-RA-CDS [Cotesia congregata]|nr:GSCOCG00011479001-RA-CDS [Cotesia congregata]